MKIALDLRCDRINNRTFLAVIDLLTFFLYCLVIIVYFRKQIGKSRHGSSRNPTYPSLFGMRHNNTKTAVRAQHTPLGDPVGPCNCTVVMRNAVTGPGT